MKSKFFVFAIGLMSFVANGNAVVSVDTDLAKRGVVFIYAANRNGEVDKTKQMATGFLISVPKTGSRFFYMFLVTARHVVDPVWAGCSEQNPSRLFIRVNKFGFDPAANESGVSYIPVDLTQNGKPKWFKSKDDHVDAAVLDVPEELGEGKYDVKFIFFRNFGARDEISKLGVGSDIASVGLVPGLQGIRRNYPIFKFGKIGGIPDEMAASKCTKDSVTVPIRVWWLSVNLVAGNSGSPIFFTPLFPPGGDISVGEPRPMIIGLQSISVDGSDIAGMTPSEYIVEIFRDIAPLNGDLTIGLPPR
jgi:hypothetical protein